MTATRVLTGAGSGIGNVLARRLRDRGDRLVLLLRDAERIEDLSHEFPDALLVEADLARPASLAGLSRVVPDRVDSLVHVAGLVELAAIAELDEGSWRRQLDVNLLAPALVTRELLPALRAAGGTVVFVNSTAALSPGARWAAYAAAKAGLRALADSLRAEEHPHGVRVSTVFPGRTATAMQEDVHEQEGRAYDPGRWIAPETVATAIVQVLDLPADATVPEVVLRPGRG
ncbi:SDR family oxidoreductase [Nocardioides sp.]|uniref:SDR family oxidoreductase n=1 Tax=Nocardioides sp. TaxID=35761 RepID=UPI0035284A9F